MTTAFRKPTLKLLPFTSYKGVQQGDPLRFYYYPVFGTLYRKRVELCLSECKGGTRVLEVGFGSGVTFLNLHQMYSDIYGLDRDARVDDVRGVFQTVGIETHLQNGSILHMPYPDNFFDTVLMISILEHLRPQELTKAFSEIHRVLKPGGQAVYGVPVESGFMTCMFYLLGYTIREHHFSSEVDILREANRVLKKVNVIKMRSLLPILPKVYEVGSFVKAGSE